MKHIYLLLCGLLGLAAQSNAQSAWRIEPGKYIGKTMIGATGEKIGQQLGRPDGGDAAMGKAWSIWYGRDKNKQIDSAHYLAVYLERRHPDGPDMLIKQIRINTTSFKTLVGIKVGTSLRGIKRSFPYLKQVAVYEDTHTGKRITLYDDKKRGIAFEMTGDANTSDPVCSAITVHQPGAGVGEEYISFPAYSQYKKVE